MEKWPKYYSNQIIYHPEIEGDIGIICGWTKREAIEKLLDENSKKRVIALGQLYSKEGINYLIRNLYLNPKIKKLVVTGQDLSGSVKFLKDFFNGLDASDTIQKEIPYENVEKFKKWFSSNIYFVEIKELNQKIAELDLDSSQSWTEEILTFPEPEKRESTDFPSEEVGFRLEDKKISLLWLKVLDRIIKFGRNKMSQYSEMQRELVNITTVITDEDPDNPLVPSYLYFNRQDLENYYPQLMSSEVFEGVEYTYGSRLRNFNGINQIDSIINELMKENYSRRAIAFTWDVMKDTGNPKCPCLNSVQALVQNDKVYLTSYFRSNDMYRAWPQNAFALRKVQKEIADAIGLSMGKLCIVSNSAHIYERDFREAAELVQKQKSKLECQQDPRGNFEIRLEGDQIAVTHYTPDGKALQEFTGKTAVEVGNKIFIFISDTLHALDIGYELKKAEIALKYGKTYLQDNELSFD